jgi:hypothetical protein
MCTGLRVSILPIGCSCSQKINLFRIGSCFIGTPSVIAPLLYFGMHVLFYYQMVKLFLHPSATLPICVMRQQQTHL